MIVTIHQDASRNTYIKDIPTGCIFQCCKGIFMVVSGFPYEEHKVSCICIEPLTGDIVDYNMVYSLRGDIECLPLTFDLWTSAEGKNVNFGSLEYGETFISNNRAYILLSAGVHYEVVCLNDGKLVESPFNEECLVKSCDIAFQFRKKVELTKSDLTF